MKITLISVNHRQQPWILSGIDQYTRRFPPDWKLTQIELKPQHRSHGKTTEQLLFAEAARIDALIPKTAVCVALDERGRDLTTQAMSQQLLDWHDHAQSLCLLIGSANGLHSSLKIRCQQQWRLSSLTLPHALAKLMLIESLYRAWSIISGHPYHRE